MRLVPTFVLIAAALTAAACDGGEKVSDDKSLGDDDDDTTGDDDDDDTTSTPTTTTMVDINDESAVGFELDGVLLDDGTWRSYFIDGAEQTPQLYLTFASKAYFEASSVEEQANRSCIVGGTWTATPSVGGIPMHDNAVPFVSYETAFAVEITSCAGRVDPEVWGEDAELLWGPFDGMHFGAAFAPVTEYLLEAWSEESLEAYSTSMVAEYIAINDKDGEWVAYDWTTALWFEVDPVSFELVVDEEDLLIPVDISGTFPGVTPLPMGYVRSFSYWYQDFVLMDFTNLTVGAPAP
jgi:hypothetical protein